MSSLVDDNPAFSFSSLPDAVVTELVSRTISPVSILAVRQMLSQVAQKPHTIVVDVAQEIRMALEWMSMPDSASRYCFIQRPYQACN